VTAAEGLEVDVTGSRQADGPWMRRFRKALLAVYQDADMELLTADYFFPGVFSSVAPPALGLRYEDRLQTLINQARMNDWLPDLVAAARERRTLGRSLADAGSGGDVLKGFQTYFRAGVDLSLSTESDGETGLALPGEQGGIQ
jgi:hypothetical protein